MYSDEERRRFKYFNGAKEVFGDPLALARAIRIETGGEPDALSRKVFVNVETANVEQLLEAGEAQERMVSIVRKVFGMKPFDPETGAGAMEEHCLMAWRGLAGYLNEQKKSTETPPTESPPSDGPLDSPTTTTSTSA